MTPKLFVTIAIKGANSVCALCTGIGILCLLLSFLSTALR